jgi:hypothetical protein
MTTLFYTAHVHCTYTCAQAADYDNMQKLVLPQDASGSNYSDCPQKSAAPLQQLSTPVKQSTTDTAASSDCLSEPHTQRTGASVATSAAAMPQRPGSEARRRSSNGLSASSSSCVDASITSSLRSFASYGELRKAALMITAFQVHDYIHVHAEVLCA